MILEKREAQNVLFRLFTALITSFGAGLATMGGDNEIEDGVFGTSPQKRSIQQLECKLMPKGLRKLKFAGYKRRLCGDQGSIGPSLKTE